MYKILQIIWRITVAVTRRFSAVTRRLAIAAAAFVFDIYETAVGYAMYFSGRHKIVYSEQSGGLVRKTSYSRAAVVAIYPEASSLPFTINLLQALIANEFFIVVVSTRRLDSEQSRAVMPLCNHLIERYPMGRDFGSYRIGLQWIENQEQLRSIDTLALVNDSLFYPQETDAIIRDLLLQSADWLALYENFRVHYHAQSFFQIFRKPVFASPSFKDFWRDYKPFSSRKHSIHKGEVGLTHALKGAGYFPFVLYSTLNIRNALLAKLQEDPESLVLNRIVRAAGGHDFFYCLNRLTASAQPMTNRQQIHNSGSNNPAIRKAAILDTANDISQLAEEHNPTHALGLLCNYLMHAPIKRDICYRSKLYSITDVMTLARGFDQAEMDAMFKDLRRRTVPATVWGFRRLLFLAHRI